MDRSGCTRRYESILFVLLGLTKVVKMKAKLIFAKFTHEALERDFITAVSIVQ